MLSPLALTAYDAGSAAAPMVLAVLLAALVMRYRRPAPPAPAPVPTGGLAAEASAPSGGRFRGRRSDLVVICVVAAWLAGSIVYLATAQRASADPWARAEGVNMRAGFIDGCRQGAGNVVDCGCVFATLRGAPPYDTPRGFASLAPAMQRATTVGDPKLLPRVYVTAVRSCRR